MEPELLTLEQASEWAAGFLGRAIEKSNISYLVQYGRIQKRNSGKTILVSKEELKEYYQGFEKSRKKDWNESLGEDIDLDLAFDGLQEKETTKHVHRLHPYKGKFIPQLVEHFLRSHFKEGDLILDPFAGSGTTLVQAAEMGMPCIGIDISQFNSLISNIKTMHTTSPVIKRLRSKIAPLSEGLARFVERRGNKAFDLETKLALKQFNEEHFPSPDYKLKINKGEIDGKAYGLEKEGEFNRIYQELVRKHQMRLEQADASGFLGKWYLNPVMEELRFLLDEIRKATARGSREEEVFLLILSRTMRSCRATTHMDLATLRSITSQPYYCHKHGKICKPICTSQPLWDRYAKDTINRLDEFRQVRFPAPPTQQWCFQGDARTMDLEKKMRHSPHTVSAYASYSKSKFRGIFSSPPYLGMINYHEQHAYAYEMFGLGNNESMEIGSPSTGKGKKAKEAYIEGISQSLINLKPFLQDDADIFLVANDKESLYPIIAERSNLRIVKEYKRPVINRTERSKSPYAESIFQLKNAS